MGSLREVSSWADPLDAGGSLAQTLPQYVGEQRGLGEICRRHEAGIVVRFVWLNTFLMLRAGVARKARKPAVYARAREIGVWLLNDVQADVSALCEVWEDNHLDKLLESWPGRPPLAEAIGRSGKHSSGLVTILNSTTLQFASQAFFKFGTTSIIEGIGADKGILTTRLETPFGAPLHVISLHLDAKRDKARVFEMFQLARVLESLDRAGGHVIVAGDFNFGADDNGSVMGRGEIDRADVREVLAGISPERRAAAEEFSGTGYGLMNLILGWHGMTDLWAERGRGPGYTASSGDDDDLSWVCVARADRPDVCDDQQLTQPGPRERRRSRIDYLYVSGPRPGDRYRLDVSRPWRPNIYRSPDAPDFDEIRYLSDHLPLRADLLLSPL